MKGILLVGPTGVGKTELSLMLAEKLKCPIISCDSMQVYKGLDIGTAKATQEEQKRIPHYMIDIATISEKYSVGDYVSQCSSLLNILESIYTHCLLVGGTGLYAKGIVEGLANLPKEDSLYRQHLETLSLEQLRGILKKVDILSYENIDICNPLRVIRALEVVKQTDQSFWKVSRKNIKNHHVDFTTFVLTRDKNVLYERIDNRVLSMIKLGLVEEAHTLYHLQKKAITALQGIGYPELFEYFDGLSTLDEAISKIQQHSRNYAKRQLTWFRKLENTTWLNLDTLSSSDALESIIQKIK
ncbi:MAG: tRNA (adenosine(37)-N6)-dimethylallyltransferase MiaA [Fusobacteria bacterium]|nr:tRNA (adenosine(37)-N6)-dimethylallyltransferase MiaA [Fusobacteriota bacterium]